MSATVTDIAIARAQREFIQRLIVAAKAADAARWAKWQAIAEKQK